MSELRSELMRKLAKAPYRYSSRQLYEAMPPFVLKYGDEGKNWRAVELELFEMLKEGLVHVQNRYYVRKDRMYQRAFERRRPAPKSNPKQTDFGWE